MVNNESNIIYTAHNNMNVDTSRYHDYRLYDN